MSIFNQKSKSKLDRIIALTGARQSGKTTLVQAGFPEMITKTWEDHIVDTRMLPMLYKSVVRGSVKRSRMDPFPTGFRDKREVKWRIEKGY